MMRESNIHTYAQNLISLMGPRAEAYAAQKSVDEQVLVDGPKAEDWKKIRRAVHMLNASGYARKTQ